jgi:hypothetical protein
MGCFVTYSKFANTTISRDLIELLHTQEGYTEKAVGAAPVKREQSFPQGQVKKH